MKIAIHREEKLPCHISREKKVSMMSQENTLYLHPHWSILFELTSCKTKIKIKLKNVTKRFDVSDINIKSESC